MVFTWTKYVLSLRHLFASFELKPISLQSNVEFKRITTFPLEQWCPNLWAHEQAESGMYYYCARTLFFLHGDYMLTHNIVCYTYSLG